MRLMTAIVGSPDRGPEALVLGDVEAPSLREGEG
jgi:hypothetical protein